jgi:hypothetical protein
MQTALDGLNGSGLSGIQTDIAALGMSLDGINASGIEQVNEGLAATRHALAGLNPSNITGIGEAASAVIHPVNQIATDRDDLYDMLGLVEHAEITGIGEAAEMARPAIQGLHTNFNELAEMLGTTGFSYLDTLRDIKHHGLGAAFKETLSDNARTGFYDMNTAVAQINVNPLNNVATQLSLMAKRGCQSRWCQRPTSRAGARCWHKASET